MSWWHFNGPTAAVAIAAIIALTVMIIFFAEIRRQDRHRAEDRADSASAGST